MSHKMMHDMLANNDNISRFRIIYISVNKEFTGFLQGLTQLKMFMPVKKGCECIIRVRFTTDVMVVYFLQNFQNEPYL